ncbi:hypothetical protein BDN71DRAFT_1508180 [Pleurotus eryngii]|uniref:Uncharacterized protein n=1 Tax=Pleurotus eryngii TaxID=5323 RepID=A0A9P5ZTU0_PLEER|nr:hypothetical protein BDN71DRAFT_1508180 [Pleurotus eryngii]
MCMPNPASKRRLYRQPPITMRVALFVLAFAAVFVVASPSGDKKKGPKKPKAAPTPPAEPEAAPVDDATGA